MLVSRLRSIVDRTYEACNARDFDAYRELLDEHVELVMSGTAVRGLAAVTDFVAVTARARPGLRIEPQQVFAEADDTLVTEVRMIDTAPAGSAEEGNTVESSACGLYRVAGGRVVEYRLKRSRPLASVKPSMTSAIRSKVLVPSSGGLWPKPG